MESSDLDLDWTDLLRVMYYINQLLNICKTYLKTHFLSTMAVIDFVFFQNFFMPWWFVEICDHDALVVLQELV